VLRARIVVELLVRGLPGRHEQDALKAEPQVRLLPTDQVAQVRRVEGPTENADA
jgi:hypothetical protein